MYLLRVMGLLAMRSAAALLKHYKAPKLDLEDYYASGRSACRLLGLQHLLRPLNRCVGSVPVCYAEAELVRATNDWSPDQRIAKGS